MFKSFTIKNFRGFEDITVNALERINLITGKNNVGKTALLEALYLLLGATNPDLPLKVNIQRGLRTFAFDPNEIWGWLFHNRRINLPIEINCEDIQNTKHHLSIALDSTKESKINVKKEIELNLKQVSLATENVNRVLKLTYSNKNLGSLETYVEILRENNELKFKVKPFSIPFPLSFYLPSESKNFAAENARLLSKLRTAGEHLKIIEILKIIEPKLQDLSIEVAGGGQNIHANIGSYPTQPIIYMGDGINHLLTIVLHMYEAKNGGSVLIDEIENGFHYSIMPQVWNFIGELANSLNVQVFATTHSYECVKSAHEVFNQYKNYNFRLYRLDRIDNNIKVITYDQTTLGTSFDLGWEIR